VFSRAAETHATDAGLPVRAMPAKDVCLKPERGGGIDPPHPRTFRYSAEQPLDDITPMLTLESLRIYERFNGDIDGWARMKSLTDSSIAETDWHVIDALITDLRIAASGRASPSFLRELDARLQTGIADDDARAELRALAQRLTR